MPSAKDYSTMGRAMISHCLMLLCTETSLFANRNTYNTVNCTCNQTFHFAWTTCELPTRLCSHAKLAPLKQKHKRLSVTLPVCLNWTECHKQCSNVHAIDYTCIMDLLLSSFVFQFFADTTKCWFDLQQRDMASCHAFLPHFTKWPGFKFLTLLFIRNAV